MADKKVVVKVASWQHARSDEFFKARGRPAETETLPPTQMTKQMVKMEVDKELMDLDVSSWSVFETIKLIYHYIFITFYVVFHDF